MARAPHLRPRKDYHTIAICIQTHQISKESSFINRKELPSQVKLPKILEDAFTIAMFL